MLLYVFSYFASYILISLFQEANCCLSSLMRLFIFISTLTLYFFCQIQQLQTIICKFHMKLQAALFLFFGSAIGSTQAAYTSTSYNQKSSKSNYENSNKINGVNSYANGVFNQINGNNVAIDGDLNRVYGDSNRVINNSNYVNGKGNIANGNGNSITGNGNIVQGDGNIVIGGGSDINFDWTSQLKKWSFGSNFPFDNQFDQSRPNFSFGSNQQTSNQAFSKSNIFGSDFPFGPNFPFDTQNNVKDYKSFNKNSGSSYTTFTPEPVKTNYYSPVNQVTNSGSKLLKTINEQRKKSLANFGTTFTTTGGINGGSGNVVYGDGNTISGDSNYVKGNLNSLDGNKNTVFANGYNLKGNDKVVIQQNQSRKTSKSSNDYYY